MLLVGGGLTGLAALLHVATIAGGPEWYRFFGAGERMAQFAARGSSYPTVVTAGIALVLGVWTLYAFSGAGVIRPLPFLRFALVVIAAIYLTRGILGVPAVLFVDHPYALELRGKMMFMIFSSGICIFLGICYAAGAIVVARNATSIGVRRTNVGKSQ